MKARIYIAAIILFHSILTNAQDYTIEDKYDQLTEQWLELSKELKNYEGLAGFCANEEFRNYTISILSEMHHYDSVVMGFLLDPSTEVLIGHHEYVATLKELEKMEEEGSIKEFMSFLRGSCVVRNDLEKKKDDVKNDVGMYSYDGQIVILETEIHRFLTHIDKRVISIDKHLHKIHPDRFQFNDTLVSSMD
jgi:hypothetical protein